MKYLCIILVAVLYYPTMACAQEELVLRVQDKVEQCLALMKNIPVELQCYILHYYYYHRFLTDYRQSIMDELAISKCIEDDFLCSQGNMDSTNGCYHIQTSEVIDAINSQEQKRLNSNKMILYAIRFSNTMPIRSIRNSLRTELAPFINQQKECAQNQVTKFGIAIEEEDVTHSNIFYIALEYFYEQAFQLVNSGQPIIYQNMSDQQDSYGIKLAPLFRVLQYSSSPYTHLNMVQYFLGASLHGQLKQMGLVENDIDSEQWKILKPFITSTKYFYDIPKQDVETYHTIYPNGVPSCLTKTAYKPDIL